MSDIFKNKRVVVSLGIILILVLYLIFSDRSKKIGDLPEFDGWDAADEILITKNDGTIRLYNQDDKWLVSDRAYPADKYTANMLEKNIEELKIMDLISKNPFYAKYDLTDDKLIKVIVKNKGEILREVLVGKASSTRKHTYIRLPGDKNVYLAEGNLREDFDTNVGDMRDREIYKYERKDILTFELKHKGKRLTFEKKAEEVETKGTEDAANAKKENDSGEQKDKSKIKVEKWICKEYPKVAIDKNKINSLLGLLSYIVAESYSDVNKKNVKGNLCLVKINVYGKEIKLNIHSENKGEKKKNEDYICSSSESPYVFYLRESDARQFFKSLDDFKEPAKPGSKKK